MKLFPRLPLMLLALCLALLTFLGQPVQAANPIRCCLDDWQGGCPAGTKRFALCTSGCSVCGAFSCVPNSTNCVR